jgi:phosphoglycerate dehydrogenase-like enzyme
MSILFYSDTDAPEPWRQALACELPEIQFRIGPDVGTPEQVSYALVWKPKPGLLASLPKLRAILSLGAGVDHLLLDPDLPEGVPIVRMVDAWLPRGACILNIARGAHLDEPDLLAALDQGQLGGALLDVFQHEPLPPKHPFWHHPKIVITPHIAAQAIAGLMVSQVIDNIRRIERGEPPLGLVDPARGY